MGKTFFISNNNTVDNKEAGIGPDAVAWTNKDAPLYEASGKDLKTATGHIGERLQKEKRRAEARLRRKQR
jgi:hypothetical protein